MSIRDVAKAAGVAPSTVSLVLNGEKGVSEETAAMVRCELERQNYKPGRPGRPRKRADSPKGTRCSNRLALLAWQMPHARLNTPVYMAVVHGVEQAVAKADKTMVLRHVPPLGRGAEAPLSGGVDGVIFFGAQGRRAEEMLDNVPCVQVMGWNIDPRCSWDHVTYNDRRVGELAADYLIERQHRRVLFIGTSEPTEAAVPRGWAFLATAQRQGCYAHSLWEGDLFDECRTVQRVDRQAMNRIIDRWLQLDPRPTGIFVHADALTQCLYPLLIERGIRPGKDVDIVSCNNEEILLNGLQPQPATVDIHASNIGQRAVEQLLHRIAHPEEPRVTLAIEPELKVASHN